MEYHTYRYFGKPRCGQSGKAKNLSRDACIKPITFTDFGLIKFRFRSYRLSKVCFSERKGFRNIKSEVLISEFFKLASNDPTTGGGASAV